MQATSRAPLTAGPRVLNGATSTAADPRPLRVLITALAVVLWGIDQYTKHLAETHLALGEPPVRVLGDWLTWQLFYNPGAAFGMGPGMTVALSVLALSVFIGVSVLLAPRVRSWLLAVATGWLLAGVAGNLTDRLFRPPGPFRGHVVDFIAVKGFAIMNFADMAITGAAILFVLWSFLTERRAKRK